MKTKYIKKLCGVIMAACMAMTSLYLPSAEVQAEAAQKSGDVSVVRNGELWYDDQGNTVQGHGGNILKHEGTYYWVGEYKYNANFSGIGLYSSEDMMNWKFENIILTPETPDDDGTIGFCTIERPKLIYNEMNQEFVLWAHWENGTDYAESKLIVAKSETVNGDYEFVNRFNPAGNRSLDMTIYNDVDNQQAYIISSGGTDGHTMYVYPLTDDYLDIDADQSYGFLIDEGREAPALVKAGEYYVLFTSGQSGWYPNQSMYTYTRDITDPNGWSELQNIGNNSTFYSQSTNIANVNGQYIYMGDRWNSKDLRNSTYVWLPLTIETGTEGVTASMNYVGEWSFDNVSGRFDIPEPMLVSQGRPVSVSLESLEGFEAEKAVDGISDTTAAWGNSNYYAPNSETVPFSIEIDLERIYDLNRIDLATRLANGSETYYQYVVEGSDDGSNWFLILDESENTRVAFRSNALNASCRYVRITVNKIMNVHNGNSALWAAGIVEVQVYASVETWAKAPDKTTLHNGIIYAETFVEKTEVYTADSLAMLKAVLTTAWSVYGSKTATQMEVDEQVTALDAAVIGLTEKEQKKIDIKTRSISNIGIQKHTGQAVKPALTVKDGSKQIKEGTDYTLSYKNNVVPGTAKVIITGKGSYTGSIERTFTIAAAKGKTYTVGKYRYKVTNESTNQGTVTFMKPVSAAASADIKAKVKIGNFSYKITRIEDNAFKNNKKLKSIKIGTNVKQIGSHAFSGAKNLRNIKISSKVLTKTGNKAFKNIHAKAVIKVPSSKLRFYKELLKNKGFKKTMRIQRI